MKKVFLVIAIAIFGVVSVKAQQNVVKINPLGLAFGSAQFSYERVISDKGAFEISAAYSSINASFSGSATETKINGFGAEGKYKFYFSSVNDAPRGWYGAPVVNYSSISGDSGVQTGKVSVFGAGAVGGYQWVFGGGDTGFALDLNLGVQYVSVNTTGDISGVSIDGIIPRLGLSLGYAW